MRDYWLTKDLLQAAGIGFGLLTLVGIVLALWLPKRSWAKALCVALVLGLVSIPVRQSLTEQKARRQDIEARQERFAKAKALFEERCETAGEQVWLAVQDVKTVAWMKWRSGAVNLESQFAPNDPYGRNCSKEGCIRKLLRPLNGAQYPAVAVRYEAGYRSVEAKDPTDGVLYQYTAKIQPLEGHSSEFKRSVEETGYGAEPEGVFIALERRPIDTYTARYGVEWQDVSTKTDRELWVAGGRIKIVELSSGTVIAERTGFMFDPGQGNTAGFRSPWAWARLYGLACPPIADHNEAFVYKVLRPLQIKE